MSKQLQVIALTLIFIILNGCSTIKHDNPTIDTKTIVADIPADLTADCQIPKPFDKLTYVTADSEEKENLAMTLIRDLYSSSGLCNKQLSKLRLFITDQKIRFEK